MKFMKTMIKYEKEWVSLQDIKQNHWTRKHRTLMYIQLMKSTFVSQSPKSETRGFDTWLTSSLRIKHKFPLATSDFKMMSETKLYS